MASRPNETPFMRQYMDAKDRYPDAIVFFRMGDFYEMFFEDAIVASRALDLTLTARDKNKENAIPMCGVPHHAARGYLARLTELGHKIAICEQVEDPRLAKGIVKREVTRVVTPGIVLDEEVLDAKVGRYLAAVAFEPGGGTRRGLAFLDVSTGDFRATEVDGDSALAGELARVGPRELLVPAQVLEAEAGTLVPAGLPVSGVIPLDAAAARAALDALLPRGAFAVAEQAGLEGLALRAAGDAVAYARATQPAGVLPLARIVVYRPGDTVVLDEASKVNLELTETIVERKKHGALLGVIDETVTAPGGRLLRSWLLFPLADLAQIRRRQDAVELLAEQAIARAALRAELADVRDLERLIGRMKLVAGTPRDLVALRRSLEQVPAIVRAVDEACTGVTTPPELIAWARPTDPALAEIAADVAATLVDDAPLAVGQGELIRPGVSPQIDELRELATGGKDAILRIEERERERTGISSLKIRYNRVFGYYLEVSRSNLKSVPADYVRKQTLANAERFVTPELAELEAKVLGAEDKLGALEAEALEALRRRVADRALAVLTAAEQIATLDAAAALAEVAHARGWVRPTVDDSGVLDVTDARHAVVEALVPAGTFVPNDCKLDPEHEQVVLITGPNMAGKSTYMRQVAQLVLLAQMGSFVPARAARVGLVDRIFTRVGAADNLARGESTFMLEMRETAHILRHATRRSLVVLDEIGRGTSTYDGLSIAWAVAEYLHDAVGAKTLFATHYHELTAMADARPRVRNVSVAVREQGGDVVFLRRVVPGPASRSYGIEVAKLAGIPVPVVARARQVLAKLESDPAKAKPSAQLNLLSTAPAPEPAPAPGSSLLVTTLCALDPNATTPLQALQILADLHKLALGARTP